jgi:hypothetical protein
VPKEGNVDCHIQTNYSSCVINCPLKSELGKKKVNELKSKLSAQLSLFVGHMVKSKNANIASCELLAKEEEAVAALWTDADCLCGGFLSSVRLCWQLSDSAVMRRGCK